MSSPVLGEFAGTFILIVLGDGVVAGVLLKRSKSENAGWMAITTGWGLAVVGRRVYRAGVRQPRRAPEPGGDARRGRRHRRLQRRCVPYSAAQMAGAFLGAVVVWLHYLPHWGLTTDRDAKLGVFCNAPAVRHAGANLTSEIIGTFVLVLVATAIFSSRVTVAGLAPGARAVPGWQPGVGDRTVAGRPDRLRHQPGARPRAAAGARGAADSRQTRRGLGLRDDSGGRPAGGRGARRPRRGVVGF